MEEIIIAVIAAIMSAMDLQEVVSITFILQ
jgi:hypothetical protein